MIKYAKIINIDTGLVDVGIGNNVQFYTSIGMKEMDVEQSEVDGQWYMIDKCPRFSEEDIIRNRIKCFKDKFFEISNVGWFRKTPKGYGSAIEALNTAFNVVLSTSILPKGVLTFYKQPDFSKEEQCSESWLLENSFKNDEMTTIEFNAFYSSFVTAWNNEEHL